MTAPNPKADWYFARDRRWQAEVGRLRQIVLDCGLSESLKWGHPCYTDAGRNIVLVHDFKDYCAILFFKGAVLADPDGVLIRQTANVQAARQLRFTGLDEVGARAGQITDYVARAIQAERAGVKVALKPATDFAPPEELTRAFADHAGLAAAFQALTPGRQRGYVLYFTAAKQEKTRAARVAKSVDRILDGKGLDDT